MNDDENVMPPTECEVVGEFFGIVTVALGFDLDSAMEVINKVLAPYGHHRGRTGSLSVESGAGVVAAGCLSEVLRALPGLGA